MAIEFPCLSSILVHFLNEWWVKVRSSGKTPIFTIRFNCFISLHILLILLASRQILNLSHNDLRDQIILCCGTCPVHHRTHSSILGPCFLEAHSALFSVTAKHVFRHWQLSPQRQNCPSLKLGSQRFQYYLMDSSYRSSSKINENVERCKIPSHSTNCYPTRSVLLIISHSSLHLVKSPSIISHSTTHSQAKLSNNNTEMFQFTSNAPSLSQGI
jgi:hypothetical protein